MAKNEIKISANVADTVRPALAGADRHPGWHALRSIAGRITTPLLPGQVTTVSVVKLQFTGAVSELPARSRALVSETE